MRRLVVLIAFTTLWASGAAPASTFVVPMDDSSKELIVRFRPEANISVDTVLAAVAASQSGRGAPSDFGLLTRLSNPLAAQWLIQNRATKEYLDALRASEPTHPELRLQEYFVAAYSSTAARIAAHTRFAADPDIASVRVNGSTAASSRPNDYFATTGPSQSPQGYQWYLEALNVMSPWTNPTASSGWDTATGFGYVGVVDGGIYPSHADLVSNFRAHFSQSFYSGGCTAANLTDVDEWGFASNCPNNGNPPPIGHGTHVAGLIGAQANNSVGIAGVCQSCSLVIAKITQSNNPQLANEINGVNHSIIRGTQVINRSGGTYNYMVQYGLGKKECSDLSAGQSDAYCDVLALAEKREVMVVAAAGNRDHYVDPNGVSDTQFPAIDSKVVSVGGTILGDALWQHDQTLTPLVNQGTNLDKLNFVAPAKRVVSTFYPSATYAGYTSWCSDLLNNGTYGSAGTGYDECTGTSMSTPLVTGVMATARSVNPLLSRASLYTTAFNNSRLLSSGYKIPDALQIYNAVASSNGSLTPMFRLSIFGVGHRWDNLHTVFPQMATAAIKGTLLPASGSPPASYSPDGNAPTVAVYPKFPDTGVFGGTPTAYFFVYTRPVVSGITMLPLYRLSKLENTGAGTDECGNSMLVPGKPAPVSHVYTTSTTELATFRGSAGASNCFRYDGIEGYVASYNWNGALEALYRAYDPVYDAYTLVPQRYLASQVAMGYTAGQTILGYVQPN